MKYLNNPKLILILIILLGAFLRFYKLDWGEELFAHPDEYHITISVNQLSFPNQMHPHFFSYGTVVIYLIYFTKEFLVNISPFLIGRFYSSLFSTATILVIYLIAKMIMEKKYALVAAFLVAITPGLIQQAHFATPESTLIFFICSTLLFLLIFIKNVQIKYLLLSSIFLGLGISTKIVGILILPVIFLGIIFKFWRSSLKFFLYLLISLLTILIIFTATSPFVFLDYPSFRSSFNYENSVARGTTYVFYTRQFIETYPILFQLEKIFPYALGPILLFGVLGIAFSFFRLFKKFETNLFIILLSFFSIFIPNAFLFAKWTRFIALTFPFFSIFAIFFISSIPSKIQTFKTMLTTVLLVSTGIWSLMFFSIYLKPDVRISVDNWMRSNLSQESTYLVEGGNTVDLPLSSSRKISIDFYSLEDNSNTREKIAQALEESDYFILQSRRVFKNHQRLPDLYPKTARFYNSLFNGTLGFEEIKEIHSFPSMPIPGVNIEFPDEGAEETWSVFDHPVIRIFQKKINLTKEDYEKILEY